MLLLFFFAFGAWYFSYTLLRQWWDALLFWSSWWYLTELPWTSWSRLHRRYLHNTSKFKSLLHQSMNLFIEIQGTSWQENMDGCFGCMLDVPPCNSKYKLGVNCAFRFCRWRFIPAWGSWPLCRSSTSWVFCGHQILRLTGLALKKGSAWRMGCKTNGKHMLTHFESRFSGCESCVCLRIFYDFVWKICQIDPTQRNNKGGICQEGGDADILWHANATTETQNHTSVFSLCPRNKGACGLSLVWFSYFARALEQLREKW